MVPIVNAPTSAMAQLAQVHHNKQSMPGDAVLPQAEYIQQNTTMQDDFERRRHETDSTPRMMDGTWEYHGIYYTQTKMKTQDI